MADILFRCETRSAFWEDELIAYLKVYSDGEIQAWRKVDRKDLFEPLANVYKCAINPHIASQVENILQRRKVAISALPDFTDNGSCDGCEDSFWFKEKKVVTWNIQRHSSVESPATGNSTCEWLEKLDRNLRYENCICDIYNEIAETVNKYAPEFQLPIL